MRDTFLMVLTGLVALIAVVVVIAAYLVLHT